MDPLFFVVVTFAGSVGAGVLGALLGLGGGIIVIPGLTLLLGIDIHYAAGASLVAVLATSTGGAAAFTRLGLTNRRLAFLLAVATTTGALTGAFVGGFVGGRVLFVVFAAVVLYAAAMMLRGRRIDAASESPNHPWADRLHLAGTYPDLAQRRHIAYGVGGVPLALLVVYVGGIVSGLLGVGGGPFNVPTMDQIMRIPLKVAAATSNLLIGITAATSAGVYFARGDIIPIIAAPVALGVLVGAAVGARILMRVPVAHLRRVFVVAMLVVAFQMAVKGLS